VVHWNDWVDVSADLDCKNQPRCSISALEAHQQCKTWSDEVKLEVGAEAEGIKWGFSVTHTEGGSDCTTSSTSYTCNWLVNFSIYMLLFWAKLEHRDNKKCHKVVASNQILINSGYLRRSCNKARHGEGPRNGDAKYT
jgi:hypothetical protein